LKEHGKKAKELDIKDWKAKLRQRKEDEKELEDHNHGHVTEEEFINNYKEEHGGKAPS
jgi:hypothetical protein